MSEGWKQINLSIISGKVRELTSSEKILYPPYKYVVVEANVLYMGSKSVSVPKGFLTDGSSGGPTYGRSWLFHDWLYSTHKYDDGTPATRQEADEVMAKILNFELMTCYNKAFVYAAKLNPCFLFSKAWRTSGSRGPEFIRPADV